MKYIKLGCTVSLPTASLSQCSTPQCTPYYNPLPQLLIALLPHSIPYQNPQPYDLTGHCLALSVHHYPPYILSQTTVTTLSLHRPPRAPLPHCTLFINHCSTISVPTDSLSKFSIAPSHTTSNSTSPPSHCLLSHCPLTSQPQHHVVFCPIVPVFYCPIVPSHCPLPAVSL